LHEALAVLRIALVLHGVASAKKKTQKGRDFFEHFALISNLNFPDNETKKKGGKGK
jgi:hypothetical protein